MCYHGPHIRQQSNESKIYCTFPRTNRGNVPLCSRPKFNKLETSVRFLGGLVVERLFVLYHVSVRGGTASFRWGHARFLSANRALSCPDTTTSLFYLAAFEKPLYRKRQSAGGLYGPPAHADCYAPGSLPVVAGAPYRTFTQASTSSSTSASTTSNCSSSPKRPTTT